MQSRHCCPASSQALAVHNGMLDTRTLATWLPVVRTKRSPELASSPAARGPRPATRPLGHRAHGEIRAASCPPHPKRETDRHQDYHSSRVGGCDICCQVDRCPSRVLCHEYRRSKRRCATVREMKEGPS